MIGESKNRRGIFREKLCAGRRAEQSAFSAEKYAYFSRNMPSKVFHRSAGFTLVEALLSVAIIGILTGLSAPVYERVIGSNNIEIAASTLAGTLRRAQLLSQAVDSDSEWGVKIEAGSIILYRGANFSSRDPAYDEVYSISPSISFSGINDLSFSKVFGSPSTIGNISLTSPSNETKIISINSKGTISY